MANFTTIDDPSAHFQVATWTGAGATSDRNIANDGNSFTYHHRDGWMLSEDFRASYDFGSQQGAGGP